MPKGSGNDSEPHFCMFKHSGKISTCYECLRELCIGEIARILVMLINAIGQRWITCQ